MQIYVLRSNCQGVQLWLKQEHAGAVSNLASCCMSFLTVTVGHDLLAGGTKLAGKPC